jgi:hypothetical protein
VWVVASPVCVRVRGWRAGKPVDVTAGEDPAEFLARLERLVAANA